MNEVKGMAELTRALKAFPSNVQKNILNSAIRAAASSIQKEAKKNALVRTGKLKKDIIIKKRRTTNTRIRYSIGIRRGTKEDAFYGHILEFGSSKMAASPFMRPALESKAGESINDVKKKMQQRIDKEIKRSKNA